MFVAHEIFRESWAGMATVLGLHHDITLLWKLTSTARL
jgi:hypothetical protein